MPKLPASHLGVREIDGHPHNIYSDGTVLPVVAGGAVDEPLLYKPTEAAKKLRISRTALFQLLSDGEIESILINERGRRIPADALTRYVERLRSQG